MGGVLQFGSDPSPSKLGTLPTNLSQNFAEKNLGSRNGAFFVPEWEKVSVARLAV